MSEFDAPAPGESYELPSLPDYEEVDKQTVPPEFVPYTNFTTPAPAAGTTEIERTTGLNKRKQQKQKPLTLGKERPDKAPNRNSSRTESEIALERMNLEREFKAQRKADRLAAQAEAAQKRVQADQAAREADVADKEAAEKTAQLLVNKLMSEPVTPNNMTPAYELAQAAEAQRQAGRAAERAEQAAEAAAEAETDAGPKRKAPPVPPKPAAIKLGLPVGSKITPAAMPPAIDYSAIDPATGLHIYPQTNLVTVEKTSDGRTRILPEKPTVPRKPARLSGIVPPGSTLEATPGKPAQETSGSTAPTDETEAFFNAMRDRLHNNAAAAVMASGESLARPHRFRLHDARTSTNKAVNAATAAYYAAQTRAENLRAQILPKRNVSGEAGQTYFAQRNQQKVKLEHDATPVSTSLAPAGSLLREKRYHNSPSAAAVTAAAGMAAGMLNAEKRARIEKTTSPSFPSFSAAERETVISQNLPNPQPAMESASTALTVSNPTAHVLTVPSAVRGCDMSLDFNPVQWTLHHKAAFETIEQALPNLSPSERSEICESFYKITHKKNGKGNKNKTPKLEALLRVSLRAAELEANRLRVAFGEKMRAFRKHRHGLVHHTNGGYTQKQASIARKVPVDVGQAIRRGAWVQRDKGAVKRALAVGAVANSALATKKQKARAQKMLNSKTLKRAADTIDAMTGGEDIEQGPAA